MVAKADNATDVNAVATGRKTAEQHGQSATVQIDQVRHSPTHRTTNQAQQDTQQVQSQDKQYILGNNEEWINQVPHNFECELQSYTTSHKVKGSLKRHITFWQNIDASEFVLSIIQDGYKIPFIEEPPILHAKNNKSALTHKEFVQQSISELLESGRIIQTEDKPHVVNPLSVSVQPSGKLRLILDLQHVNNYVHKNNIKYEDWRIALSYFHKGCYMITFDLRSGYHHIDIHINFQTFLGFAWKGPQEQTFTYYQFTVLPFGLSTAPFVFTKCLKPLQKYWRTQSINIALCLDDGWLTEQSHEDCTILSTKIRTDLNLAGLITNNDKSVWIPRQEITWLGLVTQYT